MASLQALALGLALTVVVLFGLSAVVYSFWRLSTYEQPETAEFFLTARRSVGALTIAWAFYAGNMGSWVLFALPSFGIYAGTLGVIMYAFATGIPILVIGILGGYLHDKVPNVLSFADFVNRRFGIVVSLYVSILMLLNMGIFITAEYTAVGDLFTYIIGTTRIPIVVTIGVVSILYTAVGGLFVSLITDQWQAALSFVFILVLMVYVGVTNEADVTPAPDWGNTLGLESIAVMPISLISSTIFSEAMWQRCWAAESRLKLLIGSIIGTSMVMVAALIFGMGGLLALWGGLFVEGDNPNTILFTLFQSDWVIIVVTLLAVVMSESAVDSLQNAIVDTMATMLAVIATSISKRHPELEGSKSPLAIAIAAIKDLDLWWIRSLVLVLNVAPIVASLQGYNTLQLFLMANLISTTSVIPIGCGIFPGRLSRMIVTPCSVLLGSAIGMGSLFWWAAIDAQQQGISYGQAVFNTFLGLYRWQPFIIALGMSAAGMLVGAAIEFVARKITCKEYPQFNLSSTIKALEVSIITEVPADTADKLEAEGPLEQEDKLKATQGYQVEVESYQVSEERGHYAAQQTPHRHQ